MTTDLIETREQHAPCEQDSSTNSCPVCTGNSSFPWLAAPDRFHLRPTLYQMLRCPDCALVWLQTPPSPQVMPYHYGADYYRTITTSGEEHLLKRWRHARQRVLSFAQGGALLDIGCSSGAFLRSLRGEAWDLHGIEISREQARKAEAGTGAKIFVGDTLDAPFAPESFDVITGFHVLEHVYELRTVVGKIWQWLKPGGVFYLQVPNIAGLEMRIFRSYWYGLELPRHLYHFAPGSLRSLFGSMEFEEALLRTSPDCYVEKSLHYVLDDALPMVGIQRQPLAVAVDQPGIVWQVVRKALRLGILFPFRWTAAAAGQGPAIEAAFRKPKCVDLA